LALHSHGSALLSIHPKFPAPADGHVIAACASSVEQAAGSMGFADVGYGQDNRAREAFVPARRVALDRKERRDIVRGNRRLGRHRPLKREVRRGGFGKFTYHASPTQARSRHKFRIALIRHKRE
jgi:hypothetical protein